MLKVVRRALRRPGGVMPGEVKPGGGVWLVSFAARVATGDLGAVAAIALTLAACGDDPAQPAKPAPDTQEIATELPDIEEDTSTVVIPTLPDTQPVDAKKDAKDAAPPLPDVPATIDSAPDVPKDVGLPVPVTVPSDLPPGVTALPLYAGPLDFVGKSPDLKVVLPAGTVSLLAVVRGAHPAFLSLAKIVNPKGEPLAKGKCSSEPCIDCANRVGPMPATGAALVPSSSGVVPYAGTWYVASCGFKWGLQGGTFAPIPWDAKNSETVAFVKTTLDGKLPPKGTLGLRLWFTTAGGLNASNGMKNAAVVGMLAEANQLYAGVGIALEVLDVRDTAFAQTVVDLPEDVTTTGASDLDILFAEAAAVGGSAVIDVFFVGQLVGGSEGKGVVGGIAGGIPGPAFYHGIPRAGVALALQSLGKDGVVLGRVLAHELGHFLGLWHPIEFHGKTSDPLDDTPVCGPGFDKDGNGALDVKECQGQGADNVMFWFAGNKTAAFTPEQGAVMRGNPLVRHVGN
ncbi:MAG: hypothetical protein EXR79_05310 [Myxococcales bacterium]|nr:hypothetical protein [Myxococcales bacterium]